MAIGDSFMVGLSPHLGQMAKEQKLPYLGRGVSGSRIDQWAKSEWLETYLDDFQPTIVLVSLGTNDAYIEGDVWDKQKERFDALIAKLKTFPNRFSNDEAGGDYYAAGAEIIWIGPPTLPAIYSGRAPDLAFVNQLRQAAPNYFDSAELSIPRGPDGLHPTAAGYAGWAGAVWSWLT
jgi:lysophospholipase L1-like esterase